MSDLTETNLRNMTDDELIEAAKNSPDYLTAILAERLATIRANLSDCRALLERMASFVDDSL